MTIIYVTEYKTKCYGVTFQINGWITVQKFEDISDDKNIIYCVKPLEIFLGKSESCMMTAFSGAFNKKLFDGNTILLKIGEENDKHSFLFIRGDMVCSFLTIDKIYKYISNMGNNLTPYSIAISEDNIYFLTPDFKSIRRVNIRNIKIVEKIENFVDLFDYRDSNCRKDSFKKLTTYKFIQIMIIKYKYFFHYTNVNDKRYIVYL